MKNKKLFAILTLVCFMFTLMPVAAFAAEEAVIAEGVVVLEDGVYVDELDVEVGEEFAAVVTPSAANYVFYAVDEDGEGVALNKDGKFTIKVAGDYKVYAVWDKADATKDLLASVDTVANKVAKLVAWAESYDLIVEECLEVTVDDADVKYELKLNAKDNTITIPADGGWDETKGNVKVTLSSDKASVKAKELTFTPVGYVDLAFEDGKATDKNGVVEFNVTSKYVGEYKVIVSYEDAKAVLTVKVTPSAVATVAVNAEPTAPKNIETVSNTGVEFKFTDKNGAAYTGAADLKVADENAIGDYKITIVSQPEDSKLKAEKFTLVADDKSKAGVLDLKVAGVKEEGKYTVRVTLANGSSAEGTFAVAEQGDVVAIAFAEAPTTVAYNAKDTKVIGHGIVTVDAKGVTDGPQGITGVEYSVSGKAVESFKDGVVTLVADADEMIGSTITVYAVYTDVTGKIFTTSNELTIIDSADGIVYKATKAEVGVSTTLYADVVDANGNVVDLGEKVTVKVTVLDKPANSVAVATAGTYNVKTGAKVNFLANAAGEYKIQTIIVDANNRYLSTIDTIVVGGGINTFNDVVVVSLGADSMIINNEVVKLDVAPFIENNRTMMQFNVLYVFGIDVQWVAETQSIVAEGNGIKVVMQLGSKVATVNGAEVALDVAPYSVNGRTVVPVGFITGTFGINPTFTYNADGTIADILFTK